MRRTAPLALRNRTLLVGVLKELLQPAPTGAARPRLLELGSGTGEHAVAIARALPGVEVQPSDPDPEARASIAAWSKEARLPNLRPPLDLDLLGPAWRRQPADALLCVNVLHVAPPEAGEALLQGAAGLLPPGAPLLIYGPFLQDGAPPRQRLLRFDGELRAHDPRLGIREVEPLLAAARTLGLTLERREPGVEEGDLLIVLRR